MRRREVLVGAGAGLGLLSATTRRLISEAQGQGAEPKGRRLVVLTDGNGWGHQGMQRRGEPLDTTVRSPDDWDLPVCLSPFGPVASEVTIVRRLHNRGGGGLHGNGWATLSAVPPIANGPGGVSFDRWVAGEVHAEDPFPSVALGVTHKRDRAPVCTSADGPRRPFPAIASPLDAYEVLFGGDRDDLSAEQRLAEERSLLDGAIEDVDRARAELAAPERRKFDQLLDSFRGLERELGRRQEILGGNAIPPLPQGDLEARGLAPDVIRAHGSILAHAIGLGLTSVGHLSLYGLDAHNAGWGGIGYGGDAHESLMHLEGYTRERATEAVTEIARFKAAELMHIRNVLASFPEGDGTVADQTVFVWINSGGGKHHDGRDWQIVVTIGRPGGGFQAGRYIEANRSERETINQVLLAVGQGLGVEHDVFGRPEDCPGPLAELG
ncbi:MAG: DUF1552 domain-containing protein [Myxococcota bacterium]